MRTPRLKLDTTQEQEQALRATSPQYKRVKQYALDTAWQHSDKPSDKITKDSVLRDLVYDDRKQETDLQTGHIQMAVEEVTTTVDAMVEQYYDADHPNPSKPEYTSPAIDYDERTLSFLERGGERVASLATVEGRVKPRLVLPDADDTPQTRYFENDEWDWKTATLTIEDGTFYLNVTCELDEDEKLETENGTVLGADLNVTGPFIATSTGKFIGNADELNHWRNEYEKHRGALEECGTYSAHQAIGSIGSRFARWSEQWLYGNVKKLVDHAVERDADGIIFEDLSGIHEQISNDKKFQQWATARTLELARQKARESGLYVDTVNPAYTSKECSRCGYVSDKNLEGKELECECCRRSVHRDYDAGVSVAVKYVRLHAGQTCHRGGVSVNAALKSGTLDADDEAVSSISVDGSSLTSPAIHRANLSETSEVGRGS